MSDSTLPLRRVLVLGLVALVLVLAGVAAYLAWSRGPSEDERAAEYAASFLPRVRDIEDAWNCYKAQDTCAEGNDEQLRGIQATRRRLNIENELGEAGESLMIRVRSSDAPPAARFAQEQLRQLASLLVDFPKVFLDAFNERVRLSGMPLGPATEDPEVIALGERIERWMEDVLTELEALKSPGA